MSTFVVLGDADAAPRLVTATLNDFLDTHLETTPDDDFVMVVAVRNPPRPAIKHVIDWCQKAGIYFTIVASSDRVTEPEGAAEYTVDSQFLVRAVEDGYYLERDGAIVLALVGAEDPTVDVTRALARAADSHMVIRDLTEGAITYIKFHGDTADIPTNEENSTMADEAEELTLEELVTLAAEGDDEAIEALTEACGEFDIDPDAYATWEEVGELLEAAMSEEPEEEAEEEAEPEEPSEPAGGWTAAALKNLTLKEVRDIANAAGIEGAKTAPRPDLVKALISGTGDEPAKATKAAGKAKAKAPAEGTDDVRALAAAIVDELVSRLSA